MRNIKKIIYYILIVFLILTYINIAKIFTPDLNRLTELGYLVGKIFLFLVFFGFFLMTRKQVIKLINGILKKCHIQIIKFCYIY